MVENTEEESISEIQDKLKKSNIGLTGIPEGRERVTK